MSMNVSTDYSGNKTGFTSVDIPQAEKGDFEEHREDVKTGPNACLL